MPVTLDNTMSPTLSGLSQQLAGLGVGDSKLMPLSNDELQAIGESLGVAAAGVDTEDLAAQVASMSMPHMSSNDLENIASMPTSAKEEDDKSSKDTTRTSSMTVIERMAHVNTDVLNSTLPPDNVRDQIHFIVNNIAKNNCEAKSMELRNLLKDDHFNWFANYLVVKRISTQVNLHPLYLTILESINSNKLLKIVLDSVYHNVTKLLQSSNITTSSSERSLLRNLGIWLGQMTLARNKPLLQRRIDLKSLLFWGYGTGRLIAVCSFVARIIEGLKDSKVFRPPNPWLMGLLGVLRELYELEDLKMNIKFEVQVLCKNINIRIEDIPRTSSLGTQPVPVKNSQNPDFTVKATVSIQQSPSLTLRPEDAIALSE